MTSSTGSSSAGPTDKSDGAIECNEGDVITLTIGPETYFPIRFNGFAVGPITMSTRVSIGESGRQAYLRLKRALEALLREEFETAAKRFFARSTEAKAMRP